MGQQFLRELVNFHLDYKKYPALGSGLFQFEPTESGAKMLKSYGLYFKAQDQGFVIAAPGIEHPDTGLWELQNQFTGNSKLAFAVFTNDPAFFDRAGLPYDPPGEYIYYFNNCDAQSRRSKLLLDNCGVKVGERVKMLTKQFSGELVKDASGQYIVPKVYDCWGTGVAAAQYDYSIDEVNHTYYLDLTRLVDGLYTIEYNRQSTTCYCAKASFIRRIPLAIIEVWVGKDVPEGYQVVQGIDAIQYIDRKAFHLHFGNYYYYWRYKIIPINTPLPTWLKIQTDQSKYSFTPEQPAIDCHLSPVLFTSTQAIDTPNDDLTINLYRADSADSALELIGSLPKTEDVDYTLITEGGKTYAQMLLYLVYENGYYEIKKEYQIPVTPVGSFTVAYTQFDWGNGSGATVNVTIKNTGTIAVNGWTLRFSFPGNQKIASLWRGVYTQTGADVTVSNEYYNGGIAVGATETFGFNLIYSGTNTTPTNFVVNGITAPNANSIMLIDNFIVSYNTCNDWYNSLNRGATVEVTLKNNGTNTVKGWKLVFSFPGDQKITDLWCGDYIQNGSNVTVTNEAFNSLIAAGESVKFGFNISYSRINNIPTSFTVYV